MFIEAKKLIGLPVAAEDTQSKVGEIRQIIVDPENGNLLGFIVSRGGIFSPKKVLSISDIRDWDPAGLVTGSIDNIVNAEEIVRVKEVINKKIFLLGMSAKTESGKGLGVVEDLLIDTDGQCVAKYYLKDLLGNSRIFLSDKVAKIDKAIIFTDDVAEPPAGAAGVPA
jgi:uncharacterized protein YrrD